METTKTIGGSTVHIYARNVGESKTIHGAYFDGKSEWYPIGWDKNGQFNPYDKNQNYNPNHRTILDLIESLPAQSTPEMA